MSKAIPKLLLIEKDSFCGRLLERAAFEKDEAGSLAAGLEKIGAHPHDLIVMDLAWPEVDALNAFSQVHGAAPQTPVVVVAEPAAEDIAARTLALGAQDYLLKSELTARSLCMALRKTLDRYYCQITHNYEGFLLQTLMNSIPDAVYFKDTRSRFLMMSRALAKKHHLKDAQEAVGKTDADYFTAPHANQALADEQTIMRTGQPMEGIEESETWPDGTITWASTTKMPLRNQSGRIVGTFGVSRDITVRKRAQLALAEQTELLHKKNQQIEDELRMARELQLAMLPQEFPVIPAGPAGGEAVRFFSYYLPSGTVSGDFFDVIQLSGTAVGIFICDVMGHDVRAALVTAMIRALVEDMACTVPDPGRLLSDLNLALFKLFRQAGTTMFATGLYLVLDVSSGRLTYATAAHPHPLRLKRPDGAVEALGIDTGGKKGAALGLFKDSTFQTCQRSVATGDLLVFFTDGVVEEEGPNDEIFGQDRLAKALMTLRAQPPKELLANVLGAVRQFSGRQEFADDVCLLGVEVAALRQGTA